MNQLSDTSSSSAIRDTGRSSGLLTIWLIVLLVVISFLATSLIVYLFQSHRKLDELNSQYLETWQRISNQVIYIYNRTRTTELSPQIFAKFQSSVADLLEEESALKEQLHREIKKTRYQRWILGSSEEEEQAIKRDISPAFHQQILEVRDAPLALARTGFTTWDISNAVLLRSGRALQPLITRAHIISELQARGIRLVWRILSVMSIAVIGGIFLIWARILHPGIQDLQTALSSAQRESDARALAQSRLEESEEEVRSLLDNIPGLVASFDGKARILSSNRAYREYYGYDDAASLVGRHIGEIGDSEDWQRLSDHVQTVLDGNSVSFVERLRFQDTQRHIQAAFVPGKISEGKAERFYTLLVDIDEQQVILKKLRRSEENLRITLNSIGDAVIATDADSLIVRMNPVAEKLTGWNSEAAVGQSLQSVFRITDAHTGLPIPSPVARILESGEMSARNNQTMLTARDGGELHISNSGAPIRSASGKITGVVLVFRDISQEHELRQQLSHNEKMRAIGQLAGGIAHDFNNLLAGISGAAEILSIEERNNLTERGLNYIDSMIKSTQRAADLTKKLITFAGNATQTHENHSISRIIDSIFELGRHTLDKRVTISIDDSAESTIVQGSGGGLHSALLNLVLNASQSMPEGGEISIVTRNLILDENDCHSSGFKLKPGQFVEISVRDSGVGIKADNLDKIFDPFFTTKGSSSGTGLGLSTAYGTAVDHHGALYVDSELGKGSVFRLLLPCSDVLEKTVKSGNRPAKPENKGKVLLVDDEETLLHVGTRMLEHLGFEVVTAGNGQEAVRLFSQLHSEIILVVLDMNMPVMNGFETLKNLKRIDQHCNVIISTGYSESQQLDGALAMGVKHTLHKPYVLEQFEAIIDKALHHDPN